MAHTNYFLDPSYWTVSGGNLQTGSLITSTIPIYVFNPSTLNTNGFNKGSSNFTLAQMNTYKTELTSSNTVPNASDFTLANWTAKGWGSTLDDVLTNYNTFVSNNWDNSTQKLSVNPGSQPLTSYIVSGSISGTSYFLPMLAFANQSSAGLVNLYTSIGGLAAYLANYLSEYKNPNFYNYWLDGDSTYISDGGSDMYDGGNYTYPWYLNGSNKISAYSYFPGALSYANTSETIDDTDFKYASLGYGSSSGGYPPASPGTGHPLTLIATRSTVGSPIGFQKNGNSGADGGGSLLSEFAYNGDQVNGFTTYAFIRETYNAYDPSHCDLYMLLGHPNWNSTFGTINSFADPVSNGGNGGYLYTSGAGVKNILAVTMLLSKLNGVQVTTSECQAVVSAFTSRVKTYFGF